MVMTVEGNDVGDRLREARVAAGFETQRALAHAIGATPEMVNRYERGHRVPGAEILERISTATGYRMRWLLTGEGPSTERGAA